MVIIFYLFFYKNKNKNKIIFTSIFFIIISVLIVFNKSQCKYRSIDVLKNYDQYGEVISKNIQNSLLVFKDLCKTNYS